MDLCSSCNLRPAGHGHFGLYCAPCAEQPYGPAVSTSECRCGNDLSGRVCRDCNPWW